MRFSLIIGFVTILLSCSTEKKTDSMSNSTDQPQQIDQLVSDTIKNKFGMQAVITSFGGKLVSLNVPDKNGNLDDVVLGYDKLADYPNGNPYFGAMIGRYGNRIAKGKFSINGNNYQLPINNGVNALHGGPNGFHNVNWRLEKVSESRIELYYLSKDGEEGYPGNMKVKVSYSISDENELIIDYEATTDKATIVNLTHHSFFNLAGEGNETILDHELMINGSQYTPIDSGLIPTGELRLVAGTPFDFTKPVAIGKRIATDDPQLKNGNGYDHNWVLNKKGTDVELAASVYEPITGRVMEVWTTEPGLQFYSGNFLNGKDIGKGGKKYEYRSAFCLEAQHFPDSPNHENFPTTILDPGKQYSQRTVYKFYTR